MSGKTSSKAKARLPLTERVGRQPEMVMGINTTEFIIVIVLGFGSMIAFTLFGWLVFGKIHFGLIFGFAAALLVSYITKELFVANKRQKPEGYFQQALIRFLVEHFGSKRVITHDGTWCVIRRLKPAATTREKR